MKSGNESGRTGRPYKQVARAQAAEATATNILAAFEGLFHSRWFDEVTLDEVAQVAGVTVQTVVRRFGSKGELLQAHIERMLPAVSAQRTPVPDNVADLVDRALALYEQLGDGVIRNLAQEDRVPELQSLIDLGRREHRRITRETFARQLADLDSPRARQMLDLLVIATDVYTWKLLRRDMGRTVSATRAAMIAMVESALRPTEPASASALR